MLGTGNGLYFVRELGAMRNASPTGFEEWLKAASDLAAFIQERALEPDPHNRREFVEDKVALYRHQ
ncbi:hypothetical protein BDV93DRAFT_522637 [Ceratobasidium sp. AG-I]|nr:hypothetical protein BDV93DRAFT_522637 [Ceratobasidium sp. AG-I]